MDSVMSLASAARGRIQLLLAANPELPPTIVLSLHLLEERFLGERSNFSALVDRLAVSSVNSSLLYDDADLETLRGSQLLRHTLARREGLKSFYEALLSPATTDAVDPPLFAKDEFTLDNFRWAMSVVWSHAFAVGSREQDIVLAPVLDTIGLCVETPCPASRIEIDAATNQLVVYAAEDYSAGQPVRLSGGSRSSLLLMLNHGVSSAEPSPELDKLDVSIFLDANDKLLPIKDFLHRGVLNRTLNTSYALHFGRDELDTDLVASLKIKLMSGQELARFRDVLEPPLSKEGGPMKRIASLRNEFAFTRALVTTCQNLLAQYPTSLEDDRAALARLGVAAIQSRRGHMLRALVIEKAILQHTVELAWRDWHALALSDHPNVMDVDQAAL